MLDMRHSNGAHYCWWTRKLLLPGLPAIREDLKFMVVIGLTGNIATGKSTVSRLLRTLGAPVFDADLAAREALLPGTPAWQALAAVEAGKYITASGEVDRPALAARVFADAAFREWLNALTHGEIRAAAERFLAEQRSKCAPVVVLDVPLLFEAHWDVLVDEIWVVFVDEATQCRRLMARDHIGETAARAKMRSQWSLSEKAKRAQVVLDNSADEESLKKAVYQAWQALQERIGKGGAL